MWINTKDNMNFFSEPNVTHTVITVSELNNRAKTLLEQAIPLLWIEGEISNLKRYPSGHWYFSLKDIGAQVRCVMFRHKNLYLDWQPKEGQHVEVRARATLYESRGDFQLNVETMRRAGQGDLFAAFEQLKARLEKIGLFDPSRKKPLPIFAQQIGIITSPNTAALQDVLSTLQRRMPMLPVIIYPTPVQGTGAAKSIARSINIASNRADCDVLILCRGGGSIEDLWSFNEEIVAQAIAACNIPIISGIGHETDFTIADFVADQRAPTPTAAAEFASLDNLELHHRLNTQYQRLTRIILHHIEQQMQQTDILAHRLTHPGERLHNQQSQLKHTKDRMINSYAHYIEKKHWKLNGFKQHLTSTAPKIPRFLTHQDELTRRLQQAMAHYLTTQIISLQHKQTQLAHLNPQSVLDRGYSITYSAQGTVIRNSNQVKPNDKIQVKFAQGKADAEIIKRK